MSHNRELVAGRRSRLRASGGELMAVTTDDNRPQPTSTTDGRTDGGERSTELSKQSERRATILPPSSARLS